MRWPPATRTQRSGFRTISARAIPRGAEMNAPHYPSCQVRRPAGQPCHPQPGCAVAQSPGLESEFGVPEYRRFRGDTVINLFRNNFQQGWFVRKPYQANPNKSASTESASYKETMVNAHGDAFAWGPSIAPGTDIRIMRREGRGLPLFYPRQSWARYAHCSN